MFGPIDRMDRLATSAFRFGLALPGVVVIFLLIGLAAAAAAAAPGLADCHGRSLLGTLSPQKLADAAASAAATPNGGGKLFRIERDGVPTSWLYGTIHLDDPRVLELPPVAEAAFEKAGTVVIESTELLDPVKAAAAMFADPKLIRLPDRETLGDVLTGPQKQTVEAGLQAAGIPYDSVKTLQPWFTAMGLMMPACAKRDPGTGPAPVLDITLAERAKKEGKAVKGLETVSEQLSAMASLPMAVQVDSLVSALKFRDTMPDVMETMLDLYRQGKIGMIVPVIEAAVPDAGILVGEGEGYAQFEKRILTDRNARMIDRLRPILNEGGAFVAVGALHLPGEQGLVAALRQNGWTVTRAD